MKYFVKKLPFFSIIYLHNPLECDHCISLGGYEHVMNSYERTFISLLNPHEDKLIEKNVPEETGDLKCAKNLKIRKNSRASSFQLSSLNSAAPIKKKVFKKKLSNIHSKTAQKSPKTCCKNHTEFKSSFKSTVSKKPKAKKVGKEYLKKVPGKRTWKKKSSSDKKPGKGTLKRKRWVFNKMKQSNDNYEDDIFENKKFGHFQNLLEDDTDGSDKYDGVKTPVFPFTVSPREHTPSPTYKDCYSPTELSISRKGAEEYNYRRGKRKNIAQNTETKQPRKEKKPDVEKTLKKVAEILNERQAQINTVDDSDDDYYFSDN